MKKNVIDNELSKEKKEPAMHNANEPTEKMNVKEEITMNDVMKNCNGDVIDNTVKLDECTFKADEEAFAAYLKSTSNPSLAGAHAFIENYRKNKEYNDPNEINTHNEANVPSEPNNIPNWSMFELTLADFKHPFYKRQLMRCLKELMLDPNFVMSRKSRSGNGYYAYRLLPKTVVDIIDGIMDKHGWDKKLLDLSYNNYGAIFSDLLYKAWMHRSESWNDFYTVYLPTASGPRPYQIVDLHPTLDEMVNYSYEFRKFYTDYINAGAPEDRICSLIEYEVAEYCIGNDFHFLFNKKYESLPDDLKQAFYADAKSIYMELLNEYEKSKYELADFTQFT